jgi:hypothetical protein
VTEEALLRAIAAAAFVGIGEQHDNADHHSIQTIDRDARIRDAKARRGVPRCSIATKKPPCRARSRHTRATPTPSRRPSIGLTPTASGTCIALFSLRPFRTISSASRAASIAKRP